MLLSRTGGHVAGRIGWHPDFCSEPGASRSDSDGLVAGAATLQKRGGVVQVVVGARIHAGGLCT